MEQDDLEQKKAILAAIIDSSDDAIISKDLNSKITSWNKAAERIFGYTESDVLGKNIHILIPEDRHAEEAMIISEIRRGKRVEHYETTRLTKEGKELYVSLTVSPIKNEKGEVVGASKIARDITQKKKDAEIIKQYAYRLELINSVGKSIASGLDAALIIQKVTDVTTQLSGAAFGAFFYNKIDSKGKALMLYALSGAPREAFEKFGMPRNTAVFDMTFSGEGVVRSDDITKDPRYGKNFPHSGMPEGHLPVISYLAVPVISQTGIVIGGLFFGHPKVAVFNEEHEELVSAIAAQAAIALDNAKLYEDIRSLNSKKDEFIGFASHELKTPLTTLSGYLQLATQNKEISLSVIDKMRKQVTRLQGIIEELLDISKIEAGKMDLSFSNTSLNHLIKESIEGINAESQRIKVETTAEDIDITVDSQKIIQVLINLLSNAIKYSEPDTPIYVTTSRVGDQVKISVKDKGIGIAAPHLDKIFNQYYRVSGSRKKQGMGLGLFISKEIIERHWGRIWVESKEGVGSIFHIVIPIGRTPNV